MSSIASAPRSSLLPKRSSTWGSELDRSVALVEEATDGLLSFDVPAFNDEWHDLYSAERYRPTAVRIAAAIGATYTLATCALNFARDPGLRGEWGGLGWAVRLWGTRGVLAVIMVLVGGVFGLPRLKHFCVRNYDLLCAALLVSVYACFVTYYLVYDLRNIFADPQKTDVATSGHLFQFENVTFGFKMVGGWLLERNCVDANPAAQLMVPFRAMYPPGCSSRLADGQSIAFMCLFSFCFPVVLKMSAKRSRRVGMSTCAIYSAICIGSGFHSPSFFWCLLVQICASTCASMVCQQTEKQEKDNFAFDMTIRFASLAHRDLLNTLIPANVLEKVTAEDECTAQPIPIRFCTVMFAMLDFEVTTAEDFTFINTLFQDFDEAVAQAGMFKYQHVASASCFNYIVTCPRVSRPYDSIEQQTFYPTEEYYSEMAALGFELMRITKRARSSRHPARSHIYLKAGISSGPASGIVLGKVRRFYCIFGDTVNTAARMCKFSLEGKIRVIDSIGKELAKNARFHSQSQGNVQIKGKGEMEVFDVAEVKIRNNLGERHASVTFVQSNVVASSVVSISSVSGVVLARHGSESSDLSESQSIGSVTSLERTSSNGDRWANLQERRSSILEEEGSGPGMKDYDLEQFWPRFRSSELEQNFVRSDTQRLRERQGLTAGILFHLTFCLWQWQVIVNPDAVGYFSHHGFPHLKTSIATTEALLVGQFIASLILGSLVLFLIGALHTWAEQLRACRTRNDVLADNAEVGLIHASCNLTSRYAMRISEGIFILLKIKMMVISLYLSAIWPSRRGQLIFVGLESLRNFGSGLCFFGLSFGGNLLLLLASLPASYLALSIARAGVSEKTQDLYSTWAGSYLLGEIATVIGSLLISREVCINQRKVFRQRRSHVRQLNQVQTMLFDLVPSAYVKQLIAGCTYVKATPGCAVVMHLDICNFTVISQTLDATKLAEVMNGLVQDFDEMVIGRNLTKIDTIGDAYSVVGWLHSAGDDDSTKEENNTRCLDMLILANGFLSAVSEHRVQTGVDLHARIGIATGDVICGVLGVLQPRFALYGQAMTDAATLEEKGTKGAVHCSPDFHESVNACISSNATDPQLRKATACTWVGALTPVQTCPSTTDHSRQLQLKRNVSKDPHKRQDAIASAVASNIMTSMMNQSKLIVHQRGGGGGGSVPSFDYNTKHSIAIDEVPQGQFPDMQFPE